ncbi:KpsF/GutQ family sugar-phosphate isomerase [Phormidium tenue FACHB-886]|nr:KpsF/GutQ family sugar-phosphate isomerase [Phormidium tenue FACHB-886]
MQLSVDSRPTHEAIELLKLEADAINRAAERLQYDQLERSLSLLATCTGKVVLSGVGKSGIVAQKIAATLNSIGTVAVYLHPCDALHGDLGIVTAADVVMLLSNSGETEELIEMLPHLKHRQVPIIAILGNLNSTLAAQADAVLDAGVDREACPLNLAPTTSTTVALAIGDALSMTLLQRHGLTAEDFALNHPAGRLGKRLTLKVLDLIAAESRSVKVLPEASWIEVLGAISAGGLGAVSVVDSDDRLLGIITDGDLRRWVQKVELSELKNLQAGTMMTANPTVVSPLLLAYEALQMMENRPSQISVLPVVDAAQQYIGLVRIHDIIRSGL